VQNNFPIVTGFVQMCQKAISWNFNFFPFQRMFC